jgi:hypothetical protein
MRVFITGATGFIGSRLTRDLLRRGDQVVALTRNAARLPADGERLIGVEGDPAQAGPWQERLAGCDAIVALHGEPVAGRRLTAAIKARAERSRVEGVRRIVEALAGLEAAARPRVLLSASAVGYYGDRGDAPVVEEDGPGPEGDFLARLCVRWEEAARPAEELAVRVCHPRIGVVLGPGGGVLAKMVPAFRAFVGGPIGSGRQVLSWVHLADAIGILLLCLQRDEARGPINVTAPHPVTMDEFSQTLGRVLRRPALLRVPAPLVRLAFGEGAEVLLSGQRVLPRRAQALGYRFAFPELEPALRDILRG